MLLVAILQTSLMPYLSLAGVKPDLMLLVVISWVAVNGRGEGLFWAFIGGLCLDLFSGLPFGASALALLVSSLLAGPGNLGLPWPGVAVFLATISYDLIIMALLQITGWEVIWGASLIKIVLPSALLNALLAWPIYWALRWLHRRTSPEQLE